MKRISIFSVILLSVVFISCDKDDDDTYQQQPLPINATVVKAAGDSAGILNKLNEFRALAGDPVNNAPGATGGRREVNWDGVPANFSNANNFPFDFFGSSDPNAGNGRKRGLIMSTAGNSFRVDSTDFKEVDPSYAGQFEAFTRKRLFMSMNSVVTDVTFKVPGTATDASVKSFAVIFSDVDQSNTASVEYFNGTKSLGQFFANPASQGFSLVGVKFPTEKITRAKIISGNAILAGGVTDISNGGTKDLVVMDDFIYDEPKTDN
ncbi:MAG: hypothetical protein EOO01_04960 [Chitinophagaceae bacterium]|nr:MAG: hypothetical protein EOO01_04960 [Chitinophagaceae bacterium]